VPGTLFLVSTPIGNLEDISARALRVLGSVALVCAEDTRQTRKLLTHFNIKPPELWTLAEHSPESARAGVVDRLRGGSDVALVSDAGMPLVSDPGAELVAAAVAASVQVTVVPGPSAVVTALAGSGLATGSGFRFEAFLPRSGPDRDAALGRIVAETMPVVFFESPNRVQGTLSDLAEWIPLRSACIARELTKMHEEYIRGTVAELAARSEALIGECVVVLGASVARAEDITDAALLLRIRVELALGKHPKSVAQTLAAWSGRPSRDIYAQVVEERRCGK
jgi:16S rRNA (cytidine1402-2'-O)-methyltransferase